MKNLYIRIIKKIFIPLILAMLVTLNNASFAQVNQQLLDLPRTSQRAKVLQKIGITTIELDYSRPQVILNGQDRTGNIWGNRAHYGLMPISFGCNCSIPWRAGADENTLITISHDIIVEGEKLKKGTYGLHMVIEESGNVEIIFSNDTNSWGSFNYNEGNDELRVTVKSKETNFTNLLTYTFDEIGSGYAILSLKWEKKEIPIRFEVDTPTLVVEDIRHRLTGFSGFTWQGLFDAANYCANNQINQEEAIVWIDRAISRRPEFFAQYSIKLGLHFQLDQKEEGINAIDSGLEYANMNEINGMGYYLMQEGFNQKAVFLFRENVERNPQVANVYDSLGEGLRAIGEDEEAIENFKKALSLNPPQIVKDNSIRNLKELGVEIDE